MIIYLMTLVTTKNVMMTTRLLATGCFNEDIMMRDHTLIGLISNCLMSNLTRLESDFASFLCMMLHVPKEWIQTIILLKLARSRWEVICLKPSSFSKEVFRTHQTTIYASSTTEFWCLNLVWSLKLAAITNTWLRNTPRSRFHSLIYRFVFSRWAYQTRIPTPYYRTKRREERAGLLSRPDTPIISPIWTQISAMNSSQRNAKLASSSPKLNWVLALSQLRKN